MFTARVNRVCDLTWSPRAAWMKLRRISYVSLVSLVLGLYTMPTISSIPSDSSVKPFILLMSCLSSSLFLLLHHTTNTICLKDFHTVNARMNEWMQANTPSFWSDWLCSLLLLQLRFGSLASVSHLCPIQFADQRQHLSGGLISAGTVDQRSVRLQHQVRVLRRKRKHSRSAQWLSNPSELHLSTSQACAYVLLKDYLIQSYIKHLLLRWTKIKSR